MKYIKDFDTIIESKATGDLESLTEAAKLMDEKTGKIVKLPYKTKDFRGDAITVKGFTEPHKSSSSGRIQTDRGEFFPGVANCIIVGHKFESMNEAKFVSSYDTEVNDAKTKEEVLKIYPNAEFFIGKSDHFFGELDNNLFFKAYYTKGQKEFKIKSIYSEKGKNYVEIMKESLTEAKKFKPGDMWSNDFDYEGMLRYGLKVNEKTPIKMLNKLFDSATDVNYHTPFRNLGIAIDWIEDGDKKGAKDYIKNFHDDIKKEMKDQGIK
jgi:hypothetical protein